MRLQRGLPGVCEHHEKFKVAWPGESIPDPFRLPSLALNHSLHLPSPWL
jgi:hypothetical protein